MNNIRVFRSMPALTWPVFFYLLSLLVQGCASTPDGRLNFYPSKGAPPGYSASGTSLVYEDNDLLVKVKGFKEGYSSGMVEEDLFEKEYVLIVMGIENRSGKKVIYNPAITALMDDTMGYRKPLDFTDIYDISRGADPWGGGKLDGFGSRFYDLSVTVLPGQRVEKLLAFTPLEKKSTKAELVIKNLYIGSEIIDLRFNFDLRP